MLKKLFSYLPLVSSHADSFHMGLSAEICLWDFCRQPSTLEVDGIFVMTLKTKNEKKKKISSKNVHVSNDFKSQKTGSLWWTLCCFYTVCHQIGFSWKTILLCPQARTSLFKLYGFQVHVRLSCWTAYALLSWAAICCYCCLLLFKSNGVMPRTGRGQVATSSL